MVTAAAGRQENIIINVRARTQQATTNLRQVRSQVDSVTRSVKGMSIPLAVAGLGFGAMATAAFASGTAVHRQREEFWRLRNEMDELGYQWGKFRTKVEAPIANSLADWLSNINDLISGDLTLWEFIGNELGITSKGAHKSWGEALGLDDLELADWSTYLFGDAAERAKVAANWRSIIQGIKTPFIELGRFLSGWEEEVGEDDSTIYHEGFFSSLRKQVANLFKADWWTNALAALDKAKEWIGDRLTSIKDLAVGMWGGIGELVGGAFSGVIGGIQNAWNDVAAKVNVWLANLPDWFKDMLPFDGAVPYWRQNIPDPRSDMAKARERFRDLDRQLGGWPFGPPQTPGGSHFQGSYRQDQPPPPSGITYNIEVKALDSQSAAEAVERIMKDGTQNGVNALNQDDNLRQQYGLRRRAIGETPAIAAPPPPIVRVAGRRGL